MAGLSRRSLAVARAVAGTLFDAGAGLPGERLDWLVADLREFASYTGNQTSLALRAILFLIQFAPLFLIGKLARFVSLRRPDRLRYLGKLEAGRFAPVFAPVKIVLCMLYFERQDVLQEVGCSPTSLVAPEPMELPLPAPEVRP